MISFVFTPGWQALLLFVGSTLTVSATIYLLRANRSKIWAETVKLLTEAANETATSRDVWVTRMENKIDRLEKKLDEALIREDAIALKLDKTNLVLEEVKTLNVRYLQWAKLMVAQLIEANMDPPLLKDVH